MKILSIFKTKKELETRPSIPAEYFTKKDPYWGRTRIITSVEYR